MNVYTKKRMSLAILKEDELWSESVRTYTATVAYLRTAFACRAQLTNGYVWKEFYWTGKKERPAGRAGHCNSCQP